MPSTALVLVESIAASGLLEPAATVLAIDAIHASATHASAQSLKIQLHPAELGMVTATLRFAGEQLSIELKVENHEAYRRLSSDSEAIVKSLRDLGYDIERVSVLQPSIAASAAARSEGAAMQAHRVAPANSSAPARRAAETPAAAAGNRARMAEMRGAAASSTLRQGGAGHWRRPLHLAPAHRLNPVARATT